MHAESRAIDLQAAFYCNHKSAYWAAVTQSIHSENKPEDSHGIKKEDCVLN